MPVTTSTIARCLLGILLVVVPLAANADKRTNTSRGKLKVEAAVAKQAVNDTIHILADEVTVAGFEKTLRSRNESFLLTNDMPVTISSVNFTIDYYDMKGRQMHQRTMTMRCDIPPAQTRMLVISSWDRQQVMYYYLSDVPRTRMQATPFDVKIRVNYVIYDKNP